MDALLTSEGLTFSDFHYMRNTYSKLYPEIYGPTSTTVITVIRF